MLTIESCPFYFLFLSNMSAMIHCLQLRHINNRKRILVVLAHHHTGPGHVRPQLLLQRRRQHLLQVAPLRVAVKHLHERLALLNRPQRRVVTRLAHDEQIHVCILQHVIPAARAHAKALYLRRLDIRTHRRGHHDVAQTAELLGQTLENFCQGYPFRISKLAERTVARAGVGFWRRLARDGDGAGRRGVGSRDDVGEPGVEAFGRGVDGRVRAVDGDAGAHEANEGGLLGVLVRNRLETGEDKGV